MKIGLLVCDEVNAAYQSTFGDYPEMYQVLFPHYEFEFYAVYKNEFPKSVLDCEVYMATGSSHSVYEDIDWIHQTKAFIREIYAKNRFFIGFCFGHQLMAEALSGKVEKASDGWCVGIHQFNIFNIKYWMRPAKTKVNFLMMCQDQVIALPKNGIRLGGNKACPNAIIQVGKRMVSIQGHPEFSKAYVQTLMENRINRIGAEKVKKGIASLSLPIDLELFRDWVEEFLKN